MKVLTPAERVIVAADFDPPKGEGRLWVRNRVTELAKSLQGTGVYIKVNSALRAVGYDLIEIIHDHGLKVFADLKLKDISNTLKTDGMYLAEVQPELLTVMCDAGVVAMQSLQSQLPNTEILGVTVLTSLDDTTCSEVYGTPVTPTVMRLAKLAQLAGIGGLIASPKEAETLRILIEDSMTMNTPAIRPLWSVVPGDDQNPDRIMTPAKAITAGADRIVVGRPIVSSSSPLEATKQTMAEVAEALKVIAQ